MHKIRKPDSTVVEIEGELFTGHCDSNNNELYEGDFVQRETEWGLKDEKLILTYKITRSPDSGLWLLVDQSSTKVLDYLHVYASNVTKL